MNKAVKPEQLALIAGKTRDELIRATLPPHVNAESAAFQEDLAKVEKYASEEAARSALGWNEDDFNWNTDDSIVLHEQRATAVYRNRRGELTIRQKVEWDEERDSFVFVSLQNENALLDAVAAFLRNEPEGPR